MRYVTTDRLNAKVVDDAVIFEIRPDARSASLAIGISEGAWGATVATVEASPDGRYWVTPLDYFRLPIGTVSSSYVNSAGSWMSQAIDLRPYRYLRVRISTIGSSGTYLWVSLCQSEVQPVKTHGRQIILTTTRTSTSTSYGDVTGQSVYLLAGQRYRVEATTVFQTAATTEGIAISFNGPAATQYGVHQWMPTTDVAASFKGGRAYDTFTATTGVSVANGNYVCMSWAYVQPSASGYFTLRYRAETGAASVSVMAGSIMEVRRV